MTKVVIVAGGCVTEELPEYSTVNEAVIDGLPTEDINPNFFVTDAPNEVVTCCYLYDGTKSGDDRFTPVPLNDGECYTPQGIRNYTKELNTEAKACMDELAKAYNTSALMLAMGDETHDWSRFQNDVLSAASKVNPLTTATVTEETHVDTDVPDAADYTV